jgi:hypothetical protein
MKITTIAAPAASFALTLMLSIACIHASAQQVAAQAGAYQAPSTESASMTETPSAPTLQGVSCGNIGPQEVSLTPALESSGAVSGDAVVAGNIDANIFARRFDFEQLKGKLAQKAVAFIESLQKAVRRDPTVVAVPGGYTLSPKPAATVSPVVFN